MEGTKYCMGCMHKLDWDGRCHHCGFVEQDYKNDQQLPLHTSLKQGEYLIGRKLGKGGFGITYIGLETTLFQTVAIKEYFPRGIVQRDEKDHHKVCLIDEKYQQDYDKGLQSFLREGRILARFSNLTAVASVKQFFHENNTAYLVMEYVDGISVREYVQRYGVLEPKQALRMIRQVVMDLQTIHSGQVLHRDVSADNLIITRNGRLKLIDFGSTRQGFSQDYYTTTILCKQGYSAIEQYSTGKNQGPWTDIYGLCASIYYMLTGKVPDSAPDRIQHDRVEPLENMADLALKPEQKRAIDKGIAVNVDNRFKTMAELYVALYGEHLEEVSVYDKLEDKAAVAKKAKEDTSDISQTRIRRELDYLSGKQKRDQRIKQLLIVCVLLFVVGGVVALCAKYSGGSRQARPSTQSNAVTQPLISSKPVVPGDDGDGSGESNVTDTPKAGEKTEVSDTEQPQATTKAMVTAEPKKTKTPATKKPKQTAKASVTKKPKQTAKASVTKKPKQTAKVSATKKPTKTKTSATKKPSTTAKAGKTQKKDPSIAGSLDAIQ